VLKSKEDQRFCGGGGFHEFCSYWTGKSSPPNDYENVKNDTGQTRFDSRGFKLNTFASVGAVRASLCSTGGPTGKKMERKSFRHFEILRTEKGKAQPGKALSTNLGRKGIDKGEQGVR